VTPSPGRDTRVLTTERLEIDRFTSGDADFALELVNGPSFLRFIGDKGVRSLDDARAYLRDGPLASYERHGHGLWRVSLGDGGVPIGMCGLLRREAVEDPDIGFAFLPAYWGKGYALEAARAVIAYGRDVLELPRIVAFTAVANERSARLLEQLGLRAEELVHLADGGGECRRFLIDLVPGC